MNQHTADFNGASRANYSYHTFPSDFEPQHDRFYNYMFAGFSSEGGWNPVFIGHGDLKRYLYDRAHVRSVAPTNFIYVLAHLSPDKQQRMAEALDMLASHPQAHKFTGCNVHSLVSAAQQCGLKTGACISRMNKSANRAFPDDQIFKNGPPSLQSLDTVWGRLRNKVKS